MNGVDENEQLTNLMEFLPEDSLVLVPHGDVPVRPQTAKESQEMQSPMGKTF